MDNRRKFMFRLIALSASTVTFTGALSLYMEKILTKTFMEDLKQISERDIKERLIGSPYSTTGGKSYIDGETDAYYFGLTYPWNRRFKVTKPEVDIKTNGVIGHWEFRVNKFGHIQQNHEIKKSPNKKRIWWIGDSHTAGRTLPWGLSTPYLFEKEVKKLNPEIELINAAKDGLSLFDYVLKTESLGPKFSPDYIAINVFMGNDFIEMIPNTTANFLHPTSSEGYKEFGQIVYEVGSKKPYRGKLNLEDKIELETRTGERNHIPNQPFEGREIKIPFWEIKKYNQAQNEIETLEKKLGIGGISAQGGIQWMKMQAFDYSGIAQAMLERADYSIWKLRGVLEEKFPNKPPVLIGMIPSSVETPPKSLSKVKKGLIEIANKQGFKKGMGEEYLANGLLEIISNRLKGYPHKVVDTTPALQKIDNYLFYECLHINGLGSKIVADEMAKGFSQLKSLKQ